MAAASIRRVSLCWVAAVLSLGVASSSAAQTPPRQPPPDQQLREQRDELERVRREREALEREATVLRNTAHELRDEVANLDRRVAASAKMVKALDRHLALIAGAVDSASSRMAVAERELGDKKATLERRVIDVYKRGPMFTIEAMLSAHSFGELVARYKYLHDLTLRDRALVLRVQQLRDQVALERDRLVTLQMQLGNSRADRAREEQRLRDLEREQVSHLRVVQRQAKLTDDKIARLKKTESDLVDLLASLEAAKKKAEAAKPVAARASSAIRVDRGKLQWPVDGQIIYDFGRARTASQATIHWNGIGISAPAGTAVHSVGAGTVMMVRPLGTYGLTVFVDHGGGDYTIYGSLGKSPLKEGQVIAQGEVVGETGVSDPELPAHLHFEIRTGGRDAVDPIKWLRGRR